MPGEIDVKKLSISSKATFVEAVELPEKSFFVGIQYHPEFRSKVGKPNPVFELFVRRVIEKRRNQ
jgi:CTP synthase